MTTSISKLFDNIHSIPQVPEVVQELIAQVNNPDIDMGAIAKNVDHEPALSLKILRLVNSAHYGLSRKVGTINEALTFLGMNELKTLIIASGIVNSVPEIKGFDLEKFWNTSFNIAYYAKWLAQQTNQDSDVAFTAGLISNIGTILIHLSDPSSALEIEQHTKVGRSSQLEFEKRRLGFTSVDVSAELCRKWHFPDELTAAVAQSAEPLSYENPSKIACIINITNYINNTGNDEEEILANFPSEVANKLNLSKAVFAEKLPLLLATNSVVS